MCETDIEITSKEGYSDRRLRLYRMFYSEYNTQYIRFKQCYLAAEETKKRSQRLDYLATIVGAILIMIIGGIVTNQLPAWGNFVAFGLSTVVAALAFVNAVTNYDSKSVQYMNAGRRHDDLFTEFNYLIEVRLPDPSEDLDEIESECKKMVDKRKELDRSTPNVGQKWYRKLKREKDIHWDRPPLHKVKEEGINP